MVWMLLTDVLHGFLEGLHAMNAMCLIEGEVWLVGYAIRCGGIDDGLVELKNGIVQVEQTNGYLLGIGVEANAKK